MKTKNVNVDMLAIGRACKEFRKSMGYLQLDVAFETGYSQEAISAFEQGRNDSAKIILWYFIHGMQITDFKEVSIYG